MSGDEVWDGDMALSQLLIVMIGAIAVSIVAERRNVQPPVLLALVGVLASFVPGFSRVEVEPDVLLAVVLPPLLFSAASEFSVPNFVRRLGSIINLGVVLVVVTTGVVGLVAFALVPVLTLPAAMVLAAVVSPPDAVTAVAVGRRLGLPERLMTVLKGESLINDAAALTLFAFTTAAVTGTPLFTSSLLLYLVYSAIAGVAVGIALGAIVHQVRIRLENPSLMTVLSVLVPFAAYLVAEEMSASGVLAVVAAGFVLGHNASGTQYDARIQERQFWHTIDSLLETFVFAYIGLQFRFVVEDAGRSGIAPLDVGMIAVAVLLAVIAVRLAWIFLSGALARWRYPKLLAMQARLPAGDKRRRDVPTPFAWRENLVLGWTGMRGMVSLAAAAGIPLMTVGGDVFPGRDIAVIVAFVVTIGTLLIQGLTLPWLIRILKISDPDDARRRARQAKLAQDLMRGAMIEALTAVRDRPADDATRDAAGHMLRRLADARDGNGVAETDPRRNASTLAVARDMLAVRRNALIKARDERQLDDDVMREELERMDLEEAVVANWTPERFGR